MSKEDFKKKMSPEIWLAISQANSGWQNSMLKGLETEKKTNSEKYMCSGIAESCVHMHTYEVMRLEAGKESRSHTIEDSPESLG